MTIAQHISTLRLLIRRFQDDSYLTDEQIYSLLVQANNIINKRRFDENQIVSEYEFNYYNIGLELKDINPCLETGCKVLRTKHKIPLPYSSKTNTYLKVLTPFGKEIVKIKYDSMLKHPAYKNKIGYRIKNQYIEIINSTKLSSIQVGAIWNDISEWADKQLCNDDSNGSTGNCFDADSVPFSVENGYEFMLYGEILKILNFYVSTEQVKNILNEKD